MNRALARSPSAASRQQSRRLRAVQLEYGQRIRGLARRYVKDSHDAEEVLHDVLWTVHRKSDTLRDQSALWPWIRRVTINCSLMLLRRRKRRPIPMEDSAMGSLLDAPERCSPDARPDLAFEAEHTLSKLSEAYATLVPEHQRLFHRVNVDGISLADASEEFEVSISAVKTRLHRVRLSLRRAVAC